MSALVLANGYKVAGTITLANGKHITAPALVKNIHKIASAEKMGNKAAFAYWHAVADTVANNDEIATQGGAFKNRKEFYKAMEINESGAVQALAGIKFAEERHIDETRTSVTKCYTLYGIAEKLASKEKEIDFANYLGFATLEDIAESKAIGIAKIKDGFKKYCNTVDEVEADEVEADEADEVEADEIEMVEIEYKKHKYSIPADVLEKYKVK